MTKPRKIIVTRAHTEFPMCPTAIVGTTDDGSTIYCRYRWGLLTVRLDDRNPAPHGGAEGQTIHEIQLDPTGLDGDLDYDKLRKITEETIEWPSELSPKPRETGQDILEVL